MLKQNFVATDFDGTITDDEAGVAPFKESTLEDFANRIGLPLGDIQRVYPAMEAKVLRLDAGLDDDSGIVMSPPGVYSTITRVVRLIIDQLREDPGQLGLEPSKSVQTKLPELGEERAFTNSLYKDNYHNADTIFRPFALDYLQELDAIAKLVIITNSDARAVMERMDLLKGAPFIPVIGDANKRHRTPELKVNPETIKIPGLKRSIHTRRGAYYDALGTSGAFNYPINKTLVSGDNLELDIVLPWAMGMKVALLDKGVPARKYEAEFMHAQERATVGNDLEELTQGIKELLLAA